MQLISNANVIRIMLNTLNHVDPRLIDHGKRVAYIVFKMLQQQNNYDEKAQRDICLLALLHDIGAYKTEEIDRMVDFETDEIWDHSIYGYLFFKYFSPLTHIATGILFHHVDYTRIKNLPEHYAELSQILHMADRIDVILQNKKCREEVNEYLESFRDTRFRSDIIDRFLKVDLELDDMENRMEADTQFHHILYEIPFSDEEIDSYLKMVVISIDFRSYQTVTHTIATTSISLTLAELLNLAPIDKLRVEKGAMLHDLGKTGIPVSILENPDKLSIDEMKIMKTHINITDDILRDNIDSHIYKIAVRHHEKLNGSGYPLGLETNELSICERIVAVSDIVSALYGTRSYKNSFPQEKVLEIIDTMLAEGLIDANIVRLVKDNFEIIMNKLHENSRPILSLYEIISGEYLEIKMKTDSVPLDGLFDYEMLVTNK